MSASLRQFQIGELVDGRIEEVLERAELIISLDGQLLRVQNETRQAMRVGQMVKLVVSATAPLAFKLYIRKSGRRDGHLDVVT
ncbi:MAG: hypothetical protein AAB250_04375 [Bdellovibrionota bacterium]